MDRTSLWPKAVLLSSTSAEDCARALIYCWISRFGVPAKITSDLPLLSGVFFVLF